MISPEMLAIVVQQLRTTFKGGPNIVIVLIGDFVQCEYFRIHCYGVYTHVFKVDWIFAMIIFFFVALLS